MIKFRIYLKSFNKSLINLASNELYYNLIKLNYNINNIITLPTKIKKFCVLRSPHIDKDSREHFEFRSYKQFIDINTNDLNFLNHLLKINFPLGVISNLKIIK